MGVQLPLTVLQPAEPQVADGDPLNPVLQVAVQVEPNALLAPHEKMPLDTAGLPLHTARATAHSRHKLIEVLSIHNKQIDMCTPYYCVRF